MRKRIRLLYVLTLAFVIAAGGMMTLNRLGEDIAVLQDTVRETRLRQLALQAEASAMTHEINIKDSDAYIRKMARTDNRFLMPGEIRFVVTNPEALYAPGEMPGQAIELEVETSQEPEAGPDLEDTEG